MSEDRKSSKLPKDDGAAAEASRKDREARSIAIEKVQYILNTKTFLNRNHFIKIIITFKLP